MARATDWPATPARRVTVHWSVMSPSFAGRDAEGGARRGDAQVAGDGQLRAGPERGAVDRGHGGERRGAQTLEQVVQLGHEAVVLDGGQVRAGAEVPVGPGQDEHAQVARRRVGRRTGQRREQPVERVVVEGVAPLGSVDGDEARPGPACSMWIIGRSSVGARFSAKAASALGRVVGAGGDRQQRVQQRAARRPPTSPTRRRTTGDPRRRTAGDLAASVAASSSTVASSSSTGHDLVDEADALGLDRAARAGRSSSARAPSSGGIERISGTVIMYGHSPTSISGVPNTASSAATTRSQARARPMPPASA